MVIPRLVSVANVNLHSSTFFAVIRHEKRTSPSSNLPQLNSVAVHIGAGAIAMLILSQMDRQW